LGFVLKRPKKRLLKADLTRRAAFVAEYAVLTAEARRPGAKIFFADEVHFQADGDLRGKWVLQGEPALVDSTSPRRGEKASYYSAVCLETSDVELMGLEDNSNAATSGVFLWQLRARFDEPLTVIWDNSPAHLGDALLAHLVTPELRLRPVNLPSYSPDFNTDEAIWVWVRQEVTAHLCLGTKAAVQTKWATSSPAWPIVGEKSSDDAGPYSKHGRENQLGAPKPIFTAPQMYIPPWLQLRNGPPTGGPP
jgi:hypothetical protein